MRYKVTFKPRALKDCKSIEKKTLQNIFVKIEILADDLQGDVKKLIKFTPEYRLRIGDYRVLFETENDVVIIYRIIHRGEAYKKGG